MNEKGKNELAAKQEFEKRILESKRTAIAENKKLAKKTGNKLTQNITKEGQLYGVNNTIENSLREKEDVTSADIRKELFEGNNIERGGAIKDAIERGIISEENMEEDKPMGTNIKITEKTKD